MSVMISAIGVSYLLQNLATYLFTALPKGYPEIPVLKKIIKFGDLSFSLVTILTPILTLKINKTVSFTFAIGSLLAGIGSILYFTDRMTVFPYSGSLPGLKCFVAAVIGGIGSIPGAVIGGFILGFGETALVAGGYSTFSDAFTFVLLIIMLLVRPTGIFGEKVTDKV